MIFNRSSSFEKPEFTLFCIFWCPVCSTGLCALTVRVIVFCAFSLDTYFLDSFFGETPLAICDVFLLPEFYPLGSFLGDVTFSCL